MTDLTQAPPAGAAPARRGVRNATWLDRGSLQHRADLWLLAGCIMCGSIVLGPLGLPVFIYGLVLHRRAKQAGELMRPSVLTLVGFYAVLDAAFNYVATAVNFFPIHDTTLGLTWWSGMGKTLDGAYYLYYNSTALGGTSFAGDKAIQIMLVVILFPMRLVGSWAFLKCKRWGHQMLVITGWAYIIVWVNWIAAIALQWDARVETALYGWLGYFALNIFGFFDAFIVMPYLYSTDTRRWL